MSKKPYKKTKMKISQRELQTAKFAEIADSIIESLECDRIPWNKPYVVNTPRNAVTGRNYRGANFFILSMLHDMGHASASELNAYVTYAQAKELNTHILKGSKSLPVTFMKPMIYTKEVTDNKGEIELKERMSFLVKYYNVFPVECLADNSILNAVLDPSDFQHDPIENEERIKSEINSLVDAKELLLQIKNTTPHYAPGRDYVSMPEKKNFTTAAEYYSTFFHELIHMTGHAKRTGRFDSYKEEQKFHTDKHEYSFEELVAEMGAAMLCSYYGIPSAKTLENSKAYCQGWAKVLKSNKDMAYMAASKAQKAVDYLLDIIETVNKKAALAA